MRSPKIVFSPRVLLAASLPYVESIGFLLVVAQLFGGPDLLSQRQRARPPLPAALVSQEPARCCSPLALFGSYQVDWSGGFVCSFSTLKL
jgi:hypothetical protein